MFEVIFRLMLLAAVLFLTQGQRFPINANNPAAVFREQTTRLQRHWSLLEKFSNLTRFRKDSFLDLFRNEALPAIRGSKMNASKCVYDVEDFISGVTLPKKYALRMLDSWGKLESGIATGNLRWKGRYYQCLDVHAQNYSGRYFYVFVDEKTKASFGIGVLTSISVGICLPDSCSTNQINELLSPMARKFNIPIEASYPEQPTAFTATDIIAVVITSCLGLLVVAGTCYDLYPKLSKTEDLSYNQLPESHQERSIGENSRNAMIPRLILSFSIIKTTKALFNTSQKSGSINTLHGLRFISMTWVILGHVALFVPPFIDNLVDGANYYLENWHFQALAGSPLSVDTFFFLSGLLITYIGLGEMQKRDGRFSVGMIYFYRYMRLTPAYAFTILISVSLYSKFGDGPFWPATAKGFREPCQYYWWTNLIYINNLYPAAMENECFGWGWYLANDTQFFLLSPFILVLLLKRPIVGNIVLGVGVILSMAVTGGISSHYKEQPFQIVAAIIVSHITQEMNEKKITLGYDAQYEIANTTVPSPTLPVLYEDNFWADIYTKPWCRMGAYFVGMSTGYVLYKTKLRVCKGKVINSIGWIVASASAMAIVYGLYGNVKKGEPLSIQVAAFYNAVSRPVWAVCLAWVVIACSSGYGGPVDRFLSWKIFIPLSRLTYCAYLVHPLVIHWTYGSLETPLHFSIVTTSLMFLALLTISYGVAYVVSVLVEMPLTGITKALFVKQDPPTPTESERLANPVEVTSEA